MGSIIRSRKLAVWVILLVCCVALAASPAQAQGKIALTFDKLPYMKPLGFWRPREVIRMLIRSLEREKVPAFGFVVQEKVDEEKTGYIILEDWVAAGNGIGNMTWGNADLNELDDKQFLEHARDGQLLIRKLSNQYEFNFRYFRYPLLHEGNTEKKKKRVRKALDRGRYRIGHVSVKTGDFLFNAPYLSVEVEAPKLNQLRDRYLKHIDESLAYAERQSQAVFGRNISHILQLHIGIATASFLPELVAHLRERGYEFITLDEALQDPAYATEELYIGPLGLIFTDRVAATKGLPFDENSGFDRVALEKELGSFQK